MKEKLRIPIGLTVLFTIAIGILGGRDSNCESDLRMLQSKGGRIAVCKDNAGNILVQGERDEPFVVEACKTIQVYPQGRDSVVVWEQKDGFAVQTPYNIHTGERGYQSSFFIPATNVRDTC